MKWKLSIRPFAMVDIAAAANWYEAQSAGLRWKFYFRTRKTLSRLKENPFIAHTRSKRSRIRWIIIRPFRYRIIYRVDKDTINVLSVLHTARHDRHWRRLK